MKRAEYTDAVHQAVVALGLEAELLPWAILAAGLFGLILGSFLNVVIWRVPREESLMPASRCPNCGRAIRAWQNIPLLSWLALRGRCAGCREPISVRYPLVELVTGVVFAGVLWWVLTVFGWPSADLLPALGWWATLVAYLWFAAISIALSLIDIEHKRLPDAIVGPSLIVIAVLLTAASLLSEGGPDWQRLIWLFGGAAALFVLYLVIVLVSPKGMGGGDLKLAPVTGAVLGFIGWGALAVGAFAAFALGALFGLGLILFGRAGRKSGVPFGPFMLLGAWVGIIWGERLMHMYLVLFGLV